MDEKEHLMRRKDTGLNTRTDTDILQILKKPKLPTQVALPASVPKRPTQVALPASVPKRPTQVALPASVPKRPTQVALPKNPEKIKYEESEFKDTDAIMNRKELCGSVQSVKETNMGYFDSKIDNKTTESLYHIEDASNLKYYGVPSKNDEAVNAVYKEKWKSSNLNTQITYITNTNQIRRANRIYSMRALNKYDKLIQLPKIVPDNRFYFIQAITTHKYANISKFNNLIRSMVSDNVIRNIRNDFTNTTPYNIENGIYSSNNFSNVDISNVVYVFIIVLDNDQYDSDKNNKDTQTPPFRRSDIMNIMASHHVPLRNCIILCNTKRLDAVYGRSMVFNYVYNRFFGNVHFALSFSDDDDEHAKLDTLVSTAATMEQTQRIAVCALKNNTKIVDDFTASFSMCRYLFPSSIFYIVPMTLDDGPKQDEDLRFASRIFDYIKLYPNIMKYYYMDESGTYRKVGDIRKDGLVQTYFPHIMNLMEYRISATTNYLQNNINKPIGNVGARGIFTFQVHNNPTLGNFYSYTHNANVASYGATTSLKPIEEIKYVESKTLKDRPKFKLYKDYVGNEIPPNEETNHWEFQDTKEDKIKAMIPFSDYRKEYACYRNLAAEPVFHPDDIQDTLEITFYNKIMDNTAALFFYITNLYREVDILDSSPNGEKSLYDINNHLYEVDRTPSNRFYGGHSTLGFILKILIGLIIVIIIVWFVIKIIKRNISDSFITTQS